VDEEGGTELLSAWELFSLSEAVPLLIESSFLEMVSSLGIFFPPTILMERFQENDASVDSELVVAIVVSFLLFEDFLIPNFSIQFFGGVRNFMVAFSNLDPIAHSRKAGGTEVQGAKIFFVKLRQSRNVV